MALNMYAYVIAEPPATPVDFAMGEHCKIHQWRMHPDLHLWMEQLYREKGGQYFPFERSTVVLTAIDIARLERDIRDGTLPKNTAFWFRSNGNEREDDLHFIGRAWYAIAKKLTVFYDSWYWRPVPSRHHDMW